jgi:hypothetical protein
VDVTGTSYQGEWLQVQLASPIVLSSYQLSPSTVTPGSQSPARFWILGSRDGTNWSLVDSRTGVSSYTASAYTSFSVTSGQAFTYFRIVANQLNGYNAGAPVFVLTEFILNGTIEGLNISSDGKVGIGVVNPTRSLEVAGPIINGNPAFSAFRSAGAVTAPATIIFDTAPLNRWNAYSTSTGLFTAPVAGLYFFSFWGMTATAAAIWIQFYKNGSLVNTGGNMYNGYPNGTPAGTYGPVSGTILIPMVVGDTVNMYANQGSLYATNNCHNGFLGYLIG